jgi:hypothetical protein
MKPAKKEQAVVGVFENEDAALRAIDALREAGIDSVTISFLGRDRPEARKAMALQSSEKDEPTALFDPVAAGAAEGALVGSTLGTVAGLLVGAISFAIPGIGPALATGLWGPLTGAIAGGATGLMVGGMRKIWEMTYRDALSDGRALVSVHNDDTDTIERAEAELRRLGPLRLDHFDEGGELIHEHVEPPPVGRQSSSSR